MRIVVTVVGRDKKGIVAAVTTACADADMNIVDINQNILSGYFNMVLIADMDEGSEKSLQQVQKEFAELGKKLGLEIRVQSEYIFAAMHHV